MTKKAMPKQNTGKKRKPKRRVRWWLLIFPVLLILAIVAAARIPASLTDSKIRELGYTKDEVNAIKEQDLTDLILENGYYSTHLADAILNKTLNRNYIPLYLATEPDRDFDERDFLLYSRLADDGYEEDQIMNLFASLKFNELVPLLTFDYQWNEQIYINDVIASRETNAGGSFILENSYRQNYRMKYPAPEPDNLNVLVNKNWYLPEDYEPEDLIWVTEEYAVYGMRLRKEAANAGVKMCMSGLEEGYAFFISGAYMDYVSVGNAYNLYSLNEGETFADLQVGKAGFSEFQTGLSLNVAATYEKYEDFRTTECYGWLKDNCTRFGFIERYPLGEEDITGCAEDASYYRYVGRELAQNVKDSGMTYDEYYCLFLKDWYDQANKVSDSMIEDAIMEVTGR